MRNFFKLFLSSFCFLVLTGASTQAIASSCETCGSTGICNQEQCEALGECAFQGDLSGGACLYKLATTTYSGKSFVDVNFSVLVVDMLTGGSSLEGEVVNFNVIDQRNNQVYKSLSCVIHNKKCSFSVSMPSGPSFKISLNKLNDSTVFDCPYCGIFFSVLANNTTRELQLVRNKRLLSFFAGFCSNPLESKCDTALSSPIAGVLVKIFDRATLVAECKTDTSGKCFVYLKEGSYSFNPPIVVGFAYQYSSLSSNNTGATSFSLPGTVDVSLVFKKDLYSGQVSCKGYKSGDKLEIFRGPVKIADFPVATIYSHSIKLENDILYTAVISGPGLSSTKQDFSIWGTTKQQNLSFSSLSFSCLPKKVLTTIVPIEKRTGERLQAVTVLVRLQGKSFNDYSCLSDGTEKTCNLNLPVGDYEAYILNDPFYQCHTEEGCPVKFSVKSGDGPTVFLPLIKANLSLFKENYCREVGEVGNIFQQSGVKFFDYQTGRTLACTDACVGSYPYSKVEECSCGSSMYVKTLKDCENGCLNGACIRSCEKAFGVGYVCSPSPTFVEGYATWPKAFKDICSGVDKPFKKYNIPIGEICDNKGNSTCVLCEEPQLCSVAQDCTEIQCEAGKEKACVQGTCSCIAPDTVEAIKGKEPPCLFFGDIKIDDEINEIDITSANKCVNSSCSASDKLRMDVNGDDKATVEDVNLIKQYVEGKISTFPVCSMPELLKRIVLTNPGGKIGDAPDEPNLKIEEGEDYSIRWYSWGVDYFDLNLLVYNQQEQILGSFPIVNNKEVGIDIRGVRHNFFSWKVKRPSPSELPAGTDINNLKYGVEIKNSTGTGKDKSLRSFQIVGLKLAPCGPFGDLTGNANEVNDTPNGLIDTLDLARMDAMLKFSEQQLVLPDIDNLLFPADYAESFIEKKIFDLNNDGVISQSDRTLLQQYLEGKISSFPICNTSGIIALNYDRNNSDGFFGTEHQFKWSSWGSIEKFDVILNVFNQKEQKIASFSIANNVVKTQNNYKYSGIKEFVYNWKTQIPPLSLFPQGIDTSTLKYKFEIVSSNYNSTQGVRHENVFFLKIPTIQKDLQCSLCGKGLPLCDQSECQSLSNCTYKSNLFGIGGVCKNQECNCSNDYMPVCGVDGKTYINACYANCAPSEIGKEGECATKIKVLVSLFLMKDPSSSAQSSLIPAPNTKFNVMDATTGLLVQSGVTDTSGKAEVYVPSKITGQQGYARYTFMVDEPNIRCQYPANCSQNLGVIENDIIRFLLVNRVKEINLRFVINDEADSLPCSSCGEGKSECEKEECYDLKNCVYQSIDGLGFCNSQKCDCSNEYKVVCGEDNKNYSNSCYATCAEVKVAYDNACIAKIKANIITEVPFSKVRVIEVKTNKEVSSLTTNAKGEVSIDLLSNLKSTFEFIKYKVEVLEQEKYNCDYMPGVATNCEVSFEANQKMLDRGSQWWLYLNFVKNGEQMVLKSCGDCGYGLLNACDKEECESNSKCIFYPNIISGTCLECACDTALNPVCGDNGQTYDNACLAKCAGILNYSAGSCEQTGEVSFSVLDRANLDKLEDAKVVIAKSLGGMALASCITNNNGSCSVSLPKSQDKYYAFVEKENYECLTVTSCFRGFVFDESLDSLYYILSAEKISEKIPCSNCGKNSFGYCKESECLGIGDCEFTKSFIGGTCKEKQACICTQEYNPVCGTDGKTYGNACEAQCKNQLVAYTGECKQLVGCFDIYGANWFCGTEKDKQAQCGANNGSIQILSLKQICNKEGVASCVNCGLAKCLTIKDCSNMVCIATKVLKCSNGQCVCEDPIAKCSTLKDCSDMVCIATKVLKCSNGQCVCEDARVEKAMKVVLPNGGEEWKAGETRQIKWNSQGEINRVEIRIYNFSYSLSGMYKIILREAPSQVGDNSYNWTIPAGFFTQNLKWKSGDSLKIEVIEYTSNGEYGVSDQSDSFVKIISSEPPVVIEPIIKEFQIKLYEGWNYISSPTKENLFFSTIKQFCETSDKYQGFIKYLGETPKPELYSKVTPYEGSLVGVEADCIVFVKGDKFVFEINKIPAGWNLVSFPGSVSDFKGDCVIEKIKGTDVNNQPKDFNLNDNLLKEKGYWIKVANDCSLYPVR